jgi:hypothetical protein
MSRPRRCSSSTQMSNGQPERDGLRPLRRRPIAVVARQRELTARWGTPPRPSVAVDCRGAILSPPPGGRHGSPLQHVPSIDDATDRSTGTSLPSPGKRRGSGARVPLGHRKLTRLTVVRGAHGASSHTARAAGGGPRTSTGVHCCSSTPDMVVSESLDDRERHGLATAEAPRRGRLTGPRARTGGERRLRRGTFPVHSGLESRPSRWRCSPVARAGCSRTGCVVDPCQLTRPRRRHELPAPTAG